MCASEKAKFRAVPSGGLLYSDLNALAKHE